MNIKKNKLNKKDRQTGFEKKTSGRFVRKSEGFPENEIGRKILKYLRSRAGAVIQFKDLTAKIFREENQNSYGKKGKNGSLRKKKGK